MKNTPKNRTKFLQGYLKILLSWKEKSPNVTSMKKALEELNQSLPKKRTVKLYLGIANLRSDLWSNLGSNLRSDLWSNLGSDLRSNLWSDLWSNLGNDLGSNLRSNLGNELGNDLRSDLGNDLGSDLRSDLRSNLGSDLWSNLWSNLWSDLGSDLWEYYEFIWPVFVGYFYKNLSTIRKRIKTIQALDKCIKSGVGYLWLSDTTLYAIPFPKISIDTQKRLHDEHKPACVWSLKEKSWWIHGVKVTQKIVETPEKLTKQDWINEKNVEVRRIIQDRMPDFAKKIGGKRLHKDGFGELYEIDLKNDPEKKALYVRVVDSTDKTEVYWLRVHPECRPMLEDGKFGEPQTLTAKNAVAASFGLRGEEYKPELET